MTDKEPFVNYQDESKRLDTFTIRLNAEERELLNKCKLLIEQEKDSTALKQLAFIGAKVIHEEKTAYTLGIVFANKRKNKRLGIIDFE
jgi:hypothetical protein